MNKFVAKWNDQGETHPLIFHMIDSGVVAQELWQHGFTDDSRQRIAGWIGLSLEDTAQLIAFWTSLHDIGKATPSFQAKCKPAYENLKAAGFYFPPMTPLENNHHSLLSAWILQDLKNELNISPGKQFMNFLVSIGGHHGVFPSLGEIQKTTYKSVNLGNEVWRDARIDLFNVLRSLFCPPEIITLNLTGANANAFWGVISGFIVTSDWLASQSDYFTYETQIDDLDGYIIKARERAQRALKKSGWIGWKPDEETSTFTNLFPFEPNGLQSAVINLSADVKEPFLMILEAPTGSGKTEAALFVADRLIQQAQLRGCYVAMPTQATSNQMFSRVTDFLQHRFPHQSVNVHLVHGNALINQDYQKIKISAVSDDEVLHAGVNAAGWFAPRKRTLLAPFGVGTVDQTFLSVLQTRHFFLRLFGLYRKVIIFDEVHAYDVYMVAIFKRLLAWLRAVGTSVIILSATLPSKTCQELLKAYSSEASPPTQKVSFPRVHFNENNSIHSHNLGNVTSRKVIVQRIDRDPESIISVLKTKLGSGGCAAVICNTVGRAQQVYQAVIESKRFDPSEVILFHSQIPYCWREERERFVLAAYGKRNEPHVSPRRGIVIATQVIEQSLDLDFDLLITDLAPIDLLVQRIGRLHRHSKSKYPPLRADALQVPTTYVCMPPTDEEGLACFSNDRFIYAEFFMQRSFFTIQREDVLYLPADTDSLIEAVYTEPPMIGLNDRQNQHLLSLYKEMIRKQDGQAVAADNRLVGDVDYSNLLGGGQISLDEEDPHTHRDLQALTRDTRPTVQLVCLLEQNDGGFVLLDDNEPVDLDQVPRGYLLEKMLRSMVSVSNYRIVDHFNSQPAHAAWREIPQLRYAFPIVFKQGSSDLGGSLKIFLDHELGLYVANEERRINGVSFQPD